MKILKYILTFTLVFILFAFCKAYIAFDLTHLHPENWSEGLRALSLFVASMVTVMHVINRWAIKYTEAEPVYTAYSGKLLPTNPITQPEICNKSKKRLYRFLGKIPLGESLDESTRNYGT